MILEIDNNFNTDLQILYDNYKLTNDILIKSSVWIQVLYL